MNLLLCLHGRITSVITISTYFESYSEIGTLEMLLKKHFAVTQIFTLLNLEASCLLYM